MSEGRERDGGMEGWREGGRDGEREREGGREGGREREGGGRVQEEVWKTEESLNIIPREGQEQ